MKYRYLYLDTETYSPIPIARGLYRYAEAVEVMVVQWAYDDGPVRVWDRTADPKWPADLDLDAAADIVIHNAQFDIEVLRASVGIVLDPRRVICTMVQAYAHSLPGGLDALCTLLGVAQDQAKFRTGKSLINRFCMPGRGGTRSTRLTHPELWKSFLEYAAQDIHAGRAAFKKLPRWNYPRISRDAYRLDQEINRRGFAVDMEYVDAAVNTISDQQRRYRTQSSDMTFGLLESVTQRDATLAFIEDAYGYELPDLKGPTVEKLLKDPDLPDGMRELLILRRDVTTTSTAKYATLQRSVTESGRLCGALQMYGAGRTGRFAGRIFQPHNLPRPVLKQPEIELGIEAIKLGCADLIVPDIMQLTSSALRGVVIAPPGRKLVVADYSNIEGRVLAWLAGELWKLEAFRKADAGLLRDMYVAAYARAFGVPPESVTDAQRQVGKVMELALGYEGGVGAFLTFAAVYGLDLDKLALAALPTMPSDVLYEARDFHGWATRKQRTFGLKEDAFVACEGLKRLWRRGHEATTALWEGLKDGFAQVLDGGECKVGPHLRFEKRKNYVLLHLPSERALCYPMAHLTARGIAYKGISPFTKKWGVIYSYGGKVAENATQAVALDVLVDGLIEADDWGYAPVLHVHDEIIAEVPDSPNFNARELEALMTKENKWNVGLPLHAKGFEGYRYKKG